MIRDHEFVNLKGLIYFTDGEGIFPERQPSYQSAFVFIKDDYKSPKLRGLVIPSLSRILLCPRRILPTNGMRSQRKRKSFIGG